VLNNAAARKVAAVVIDPPAKLLVKMKVSPDVITLVGTIGASASALILLPQGEFLWAIVLIAIFALSDLIDGTMARMTGSSGPWGNFLDATLDRVTDGAVFGALVIWGATQQNMWIVCGGLLALVTGQVTSYSKARAEAVGATANVGIAERAERLILAGIGILLTGLGVPYVLAGVLWLVGVAGVVTVIQRMVEVRRQLRGSAHGD
jgi:CDP-diacylglycerol---glycerol-3-phosphate 3-phosphatidyltransferase